MLRLSLAATSDEMVMTLKEKSVLTAPFYLFVATHVTTRERVAFVLPTDESPYPIRYNLFHVNTSVLFSGTSSGGWLYKVYEQASNTNTDPTGLNQVEEGKLSLESVTQFSYQKGYEPQTSFKAYGG
jgi:hypothetical protein